jgi:translocation and assembly module TamB
MKRLGKALFRISVGLVALALLLATGVFVLLHTSWLRQQVRERIILEAEKATGGKVAISSFDFNPYSLSATVVGFELRGKEPASDPPLARVGRIQVGIRVVSMLRRDVYLESLLVQEPRIRIVFYPDGTTNIPGPKIPPKDPKSVFEHFVSLSARKFELSNGTFELDHRRVPLQLGAEQLSVRFGWEPDRKRYRGTVSASPFRIDWPKIFPLVFAASVELAMDRAGLELLRSEVTRNGSRAGASGTLLDYRSPKIDLAVNGSFEMKEFAPLLRLPISPEGTTRFDGRFAYGGGQYKLSGKLRGDRLAVRRSNWAVDQASMEGDVELTPDLVTIRNAVSRALGGRFDGSAEIRAWRSFTVTGAVTNLSLDEIRDVENTVRPLAWSANVSGPVELSGDFDLSGVDNLRVATHLDLEPVPGRIPLQGRVVTRYTESGVVFERSNLQTPGNRVEFSGSLSDRIEVSLESKDVNEFLPAAALVTETPPLEIPVQIDGGVARFRGTITSVLRAPRIRGEVSATRCVYQKWRLARISATVDVDATRLRATNLTAEYNGTALGGAMEAALAGWRITAASALTGQIEVRGAVIEEILKDYKLPVALRGAAAAALHIEGQVEAPRVSGKLTLNGAGIAEEPFERIQFDLNYQPRRVDIRKGKAVHPGGAIDFECSYQPTENNPSTGPLDFHITAKNLSVGASAYVRKWREDAGGRADVAASGRLQIQNSSPSIASLQGALSLRAASLRKQELGAIELRAKSEAERLRVSAAGSLLGSPISGSGEWQLRGDAGGLGNLELGAFTLAKARSLLDAFGAGQRLPFDGSFQSEVVFTGALRKPSTFRALANLSRVEFKPSNEDRQLSDAVVEELTLRNSGPIVLEIDSRGLHVQRAELTGKETNLQVTGSIALGARTPWNIVLLGGVNLGILQNYVPGLRTTGTATVNATVRGALSRPMLGGKMEIRDISVYHRDLTIGIEKANGTVAFDRQSALLQNFTAQTGGGEMKLNGFITFGEDERISYRVNGQLERVRIRYPEGASTTVNAGLTLTGGNDQSLVTGVVTVLRSGFTPRTDIGSLLLEPSRPVQAPPSSPLLRAMQFDVKLVNAPNLQLETSLTKGMQAKVDLRLRGSPAKPVLLGTVSVTQGELNFFGTTYDITRGTVSFFNAARIEPVLALDLETTVRAVVVNMNISGTIDKPNITYRSDPPLETSDIIALLAVGRTPTEAAVATQSNFGGRGNSFFAGTETLLGQAIGAGVSGRLQRFFGISRVKIDPQQINVDTTPQARLTIEQQISREITLTYVTNLTGALQQLVRLQWDASRNWSLSAVRDENGVIGADILFRKRLK